MQYKKVSFLLIISLQTLIILSMDLNGPMDDDFGLSSLFVEPVAGQLPTSLRDESIYRVYPKYQEINTRRNEVLAAAAVVSPQKESFLKRKFIKESDENQQHFQQLSVLLQQGVVSPQQIISKIKMIKPTPGETKLAAAGLVVSYMTNELPAVASPSKKQKMIDTRNAVASQAPTPLLRQIAPIDVHHTQYGKLTTAKNGMRIFKGGHNAELAFAQQFLITGQYVFTDKSNRNIGAFIDRDCPKTLGYGFDDYAVEHAVRSAITIAKNPLNPYFRLSQVFGKDLVGSYQEEFGFPTVFPILWVNGNGLINGQVHQVARFCQLDQSGRLQTTTDSRDIVKLSLEQFDGMMLVSTKKLKTGDDKVLISDITDSMQIHCVEQLTRLGFNQLSSTIYGIKDDRP